MWRVKRKLYSSAASQPYAVVAQSYDLFPSTRALGRLLVSPSLVFPSRSERKSLRVQQIYQNLDIFVGARRDFNPNRWGFYFCACVTAILDHVTLSRPITSRGSSLGTSTEESGDEHANVRLSNISTHIALPIVYNKHEWIGFDDFYDNGYWNN
ncbi:hypothetical protein J6590_101835 [Homalodisca vitripennis]|nr:hypothetical protein J6590_101835 [Homalodisca vitripennis]